MMHEGDRPKKTKLQGKDLLSENSTPCEDKDGKIPALKVRFVLPEGNLKPADNTANLKELTVSQTLPSICEFTMFSNNQRTSNADKGTPQSARPLTKLPPMFSNNTKLIASASGGLAKHKKAGLDNKGPVKCTTQDIRMEIKCKLPEDYRDPTYKETKKRIWDWLEQSEEHKPAYVRRAHAFSKTVTSNPANMQRKTQSSQQKSLTQRAGL